MQNITGIFPDKKKADDALNELINKGYDKSDVSIVLKHDDGEIRIGKKGGFARRDITSGVLSGGIVGGITGVILGVGSFAVPGIGALIFAGPIAAALGLTGAAALTISGATSGVLAGGLVGGLVELGLSTPDARYYEQQLKNGGVLLSVPAEDRKSLNEVIDLMQNHGVENLKKTDI